MAIFDSADAWIAAHKKEAALGGGGVLVVLLALYQKRKTAAAAAAPGTSAASQAAAANSGGAGIGVPGTTTQDVQNAVQDQINDDVAGLRTQFQQEIAALPPGPQGPAGPAGKLPPVTGEYLVNQNQLAHKAKPLTDAQYLATHPGGTLENAAQRNNIVVHTPKPAPKPKPNPVVKKR